MAIVSAAGDIEARYDYWIELGRRAEREQIIELLEELKNKPCHSQTELTQHIIKDAIALIKGENVV